MKTFVVGMCMTMAVLALTGCSKKDGAEDGGDGPSTAPADAPAAAPAPGADAGSGLKAGAWQMTTAVAGMPKGMVSTMCLDETLSKKFSELGSSVRGDMDCSNKSVSRTGNTIDIAATCKQADRTVDSKIHVEMQGENAYHQTVESTFDPPLMGKSSATTTVDGKWLGTCESQGLKPGDMVMPGGMKMNIADMKKHG
ncbi:MAG: DUF3617 family protein [Asticcacaulis sp.]|nr:DUF3617 family protein [Asticcacaulis sp.]